MIGDPLFDKMKAITEGRVIKESSNEWNSLELDLVALKQRLMDKIDKADPKYDEVFAGFEALLASVTSANRAQNEAPPAPIEDLSPGLDAPVGDAANAEGGSGPIPVEDEEEEEEAPTEDTLESVLSEKDDKKKEEEWADSRSHDEAVKQIVKDSWKEIYVDGKFKGDAEPSRDDVMKEVEFQSKHGLDHRQDASAIRYDAYKKLMKKVKNITKKLDAESDETPEEDDAEAKTFLGMKT